MADDKVNEVPTEVSFVLPPWATSPLEGLGPLVDVEARMALVLQLAAATVANSSGGPFAAALFTLGDGRIVAAGVNLVLATRAPVAHAEIVAIALAGSRLGTHDLARAGPLELVTSCEPCAMCMGAILWCRLGRLVYAASVEQLATKIDQIMVSSAELAAKAPFVPISIKGGVLADEAMNLFAR